MPSKMYYVNNKEWLNGIFPIKVNIDDIHELSVLLLLFFVVISVVVYIFVVALVIFVAIIDDDDVS